MALRAAVSVFKYLGDEVVAESLIETANDLRTQFGVIEIAYFAETGKTIILVPAWDEWIRNHFRKVSTDAQVWVTNNIAAMRQIYAVRTDAAAFQVMEDLVDIEEDIDDMFMDETVFDRSD